MGAFYVSAGPFNYVPPSGDEQIKSVTDSQYGWVWYRGITSWIDCPVCKGLGQDPNAKWKPPMSKDEWAATQDQRDQMVKDLSKKMGKKRILDE